MVITEFQHVTDESVATLLLFLTSCMTRCFIFFLHAKNTACCFAVWEHVHLEYESVKSSLHHFMWEMYYFLWFEKSWIAWLFHICSFHIRGFNIIINSYHSDWWCCFGVGIEHTSTKNLTITIKPHNMSGWLTPTNTFHIRQIRIPYEIWFKSREKIDYFTIGNI